MSPNLSSGSGRTVLLSFRSQTQISAGNKRLTTSVSSRVSYYASVRPSLSEDLRSVSLWLGLLAMHLLLMQDEIGEPKSVERSA